MSHSYLEIVKGETLLRVAPDWRHEEICDRLHSQVALSLAHATNSRLLSRRSVVEISSGTLIRPDLALVAASTGKLWLAAEIVNSQDHRIDTVVKKALYEEMNLPRLWMIDPRYDNVEIYHGSDYGLALRQILAAREMVTEKLLPTFQLLVADLFGVRQVKS